MRGASAAPGGNAVPADARYLCIDAGPFGAGRGHQDRLGLDLYAYGRSLLIDPGRYLATEAGAWFRTSAAHNTVLVDGQGQNRRSLTESPAPGVPPSRSEAVTAAAASRWSSSVGIDFFEGSYEDGYGPSNDRAVKHVRQVLFVKPAYWVVWDRMVPDRGAVRAHRFEQLWHFPPGRVVVEQARQLAATEDERKANLALLPVTSEATVRVITGGPTNAGAEPLQGWYSPEYGVREAAPVAVYRLEATPPVLFETVLYPYAAGRRPAFAAERVPVTSGGEPAAAHQVSAFQFRYGGFVDLILAAHAPHHAATLKQAGDLRTDAETVVLRLDAAGQPVRLLARAVSTVAYAGQTLFAAEKTQDSVDRDISR